MLTGVNTMPSDITRSAKWYPCQPWRKQWRCRQHVLPKHW